MKLTNEMLVPASLDEAWTVLLDVERIAPCLPGASIDSQDGDEYHGSMAVKLGPITSRFTGTIKIDEADEAAHRAVLVARARDSRGQGTASATITSSMAATEEGTRVTVETDLRVTGPAASFGRGVMQDVSAKMMGRFAECLAAEMGRSAADAAAAAGSATAGAGAQETSSGEPAAASAAEGAHAVPLAGPLPPDVPEPPPTEAGVRWPAGEAGAGEPAEGPHETSSPRTQRGELPSGEAEDVLDLGAVSREALVKRLVPLAAAAALVLLLGALLRRRSNR